MKWGGGGGADAGSTAGGKKTVISFGRDTNFRNEIFVAFNVAVKKTVTCISQNANPSKIEEAK